MNFAAFLAFGIHGLAQHGLAVLAERADGAKRREVGLDLHLERGRGVVVALAERRPQAETVRLARRLRQRVLVDGVALVRGELFAEFRRVLAGDYGIGLV